MIFFQKSIFKKIDVRAENIRVAPAAAAGRNRETSKSSPE